MRPISQFREERGASAVTIAITLIVLMGAAAVAIDLAAGFNERRQDQSASDLAAMAGALAFTQGSTVIIDEVMASARANVDTTYSDAEWETLWTGCTDPERPSGYVTLSHSTLGTIDCISVNPSFLRVRMPDQTVATTFGRIIGFDSITTHAETEVTLLNPNGSGGLPFALRGDAVSGEVCLDTSTGSKIVPPCDGNESGSYGNIAPPLFGNGDLNTTPECQHQTSANNHVAESIAMGMDHTLFKMSMSDWNDGGLDPDDQTQMNKSNVDPITELDECVDVGGPLAEHGDGSPINGVYIDTGNSVKADITEGLITGTGFSDGDDALLTRSGTTRDVDGYELDNIPLWSHLEDQDMLAWSGPLECDSTEYTDPSLTIDAKNLMIRTCVEDWTASDGRIFNKSILDSPRLGTAPRLWFNVLGSGLSYSPVQSFDIVYVHGIWFDDKDETVFYPGEDTADLTMKKWKEVEQVTAFLLQDEMVSADVLAALGGVTNDTFQPTIYK